MNFNHVNKDYYIVTQDYSKTFDSGIDQFKIDIIKGKIPDLFISGGSLDTKLMENNNAFENLSEYIKNSKISFEDFYPKDIDNSEIFYISPVIGFGVIENNSILSEFEGGISTADFLEKSKKYNLKFSNCTISQLFDYLVVDNLDDYVDYTSKKCYFKTDTFVDLMEYIKNAESSNGELKLAIYNNFYELMNFSSEKSYFDISDKGLFTAHINENIKMSIYINSEYKDVIWGFIESVFDSGEQILNYGLPVSKDINGLNYYNSYAISNQKLFSLLSRGRLVNISDKNIHNILYNELDSFINGKITASEYAENVQNQIMLYLSEL
ncbi:hypothetical protein [Ruminococcus sp. HUN007]|uniref:hypothetical protein n=1 Tax=Ruminococcus sp. HUN007 TaxID=1514668 RepID=UPI0005D20161|nr:hypothetical protein [Ruminococcus sp. HUN007]